MLVSAGGNACSAYPAAPLRWNLSKSPEVLTASRAPCPLLVPTGSSTVQRQTLGGDTPWWLALLSSWVGPRVQNWIA